MNRPKLLVLLACVWASAGSALGQYGQIAPGLRSTAPGSIGAPVPSLFSGGAPSIAPPASKPFQASPAPANAQPVRRSVHPAVVRVVAPGRGSVSYGSGSLVAVNEQHGLVITNWHVINEATGQITVEFPDGFESPATLQKVDRDWDLAALAIWRPQVAPVPLARQAPQPGEILTIAGYGPGKYRAVSGPCTQYVAPGERFPYEMVELAAAARQGDSGGPILNSRGELAGVLFGEGAGRTAGSYCGRVQWFLDSVTGRPIVAPATGAMIAQAKPVGQPITGPLENIPRGTNPAPGESAVTQNRASADSASPPVKSEVWPPEYKGLPSYASSGGLASAPQQWRSNTAGGYQPPVELTEAPATARAKTDRMPQVASVGKGATDPLERIAESASSSPDAPDANSAATPAESQVSSDRWAQLKAFGGVVAAVGLLLLIIRSLAASGAVPDEPQKGAKLPRKGEPTL